MLVHRRDEHKYVRYFGVDIEQLIKVEHDSWLNQITQIIDAEIGAKEYKAIFEDGSVDWITVVNDSHPKVQEYLRLVSEKVEVHSLREAAWMNPIWENK